MVTVFLGPMGQKGFVMRTDSSHSDTAVSSADPQSTSKPISARKREANRANAQRSTGPRTDEGKARSAMNAVRHGLAARAPLLPGEDAAELQQLADEMEADWRPRGAIERELVGRVVSLTWRLRRIARAEETLWAEEDAERVDNHERWAKMTAQFGIQDLPWDNDPKAAPPPAATGDQFLARQFTSRSSRGNASSALERLAVYEQRLDRSLHAALRQLQQLRKMREREDEHDRDRDRDDIAPVQNEPTAKTEPFSPVERSGEQARGLNEELTTLNVQNEPTDHPPNAPIEVESTAPMTSGTT